MDLHVFPIQSPLPPPSPSHSSGSSQCTRPEHLSHASNLDWRSVSLLIVYLFQCYSLRTSHPCLLPQSRKVHSVHLCLFFCFVYRIIVTIFLNSYIWDSFLKETEELRQGYNLQFIQVIKRKVLLNCKLPIARTKGRGTQASMKYD